LRLDLELGDFSVVIKAHQDDAFELFVTDVKMAQSLPPALPVVNSSL
jgi:hypothetical protein